MKMKEFEPGASLAHPLGYATEYVFVMMEKNQNKLKIEQYWT